MRDFGLHPHEKPDPISDEALERLIEQHSHYIHHDDWALILRIFELKDRLEEAEKVLDFYADEKMYTENAADHDCYIPRRHTWSECDHGQKAREFLQKDEK